MRNKKISILSKKKKSRTPPTRLPPRPDVSFVSILRTDKADRIIGISLKSKKV